MKKIFTLLLALVLVLPVFAQYGDEKKGPSQVEIAATGIAEIYKKSLNLSKEQYAKVKQIYLKFLTYQTYNPGIPGLGCEKLEKDMAKVLSEEQYPKWRQQDPNRPMTEAQKKEYKEKKKKVKYGEQVRMSDTPPAEGQTGGAPTGEPPAPGQAPGRPPRQ